MAEETNTSQELLSEGEVFNILEFANALTQGSFYQGVLNPMLINERMKELNLAPLQATEDNLNKALNNAKNSEIALQGYSQDFENKSQPYKRLLSYLGNMLSWDFTYTCLNAKSSDYTGKQYQKDLDVLKKFLDNLDYKKEFTMAVHEMIRNEAFFFCTRFNDNEIALQELNASPTYTMITGRSAKTLLFSFNMVYFLQPGVDIRMFPSFFGKKFNTIFGGSDKVSTYNPSLIADHRDSSWVYWQDVPIGQDPFGWCFKLNSEVAARLPYFTGMFSDLVQQDLLRALQKNINMSVAARMISGEIPMLKDTAAKVKDQFSLTPATLGNFLAYVKAAIGDSLRAVALPLNNVKALEFSSQPDIYPSFLRNLVATSGINANLIFTNQNRTNAIESMLSIGIDEQLIEQVYPQFGAFINYHVNRLTKNFKFKVEFEGTNNYTNRDQRMTRVKDLADRGVVMPNKFAAAIGMNPFDMQRQMEEAKAMGWVDKLTPIVMGNQMPNEGAGRPAKSDTEIGDEGASTKTTGGNVEKGGKTNPQ